MQLLQRVLAEALNGSEKWKVSQTAGAMLTWWQWTELEKAEGFSGAEPASGLQ